MNKDSECPPIYIHMRSECNEALEEARRVMVGAGITPDRWNLAAMGCGHGQHVEDVEIQP